MMQKDALAKFIYILKELIFNNLSYTLYGVVFYLVIKKIIQGLMYLANYEDGFASFGHV